MHDVPTLDTKALQAALAGGNALLVDILPPEYFERGHIPGAVNACVYEVVFLEHIAATGADPNRPLILYGSGPRNRAPYDAARKLALAGYADLRVYPGGIKEWAAAGLPMEGTGAALPWDTHWERLKEGRQTLAIDPALSTLEWFGRNKNSKHHGTLTVASGRLELDQGRLVGGEVAVDMTSLVDLDLVSAFWNRILVAHLCSDDFFEVDAYPTARFAITEARALADATPGTPNYVLAGEMTIKDVSRPQGVSVTMEVLDDGNVVVEGHFDFDRTLWNVLYGSGKFYEKLGMHLVHDLVSLQLRLVAGRS